MEDLCPTLFYPIYMANGSLSSYLKERKNLVIRDDDNVAINSEYCLQSVCLSLHLAITYRYWNKI